MKAGVFALTGATLVATGLLLVSATPVVRSQSAAPKIELTPEELKEREDRKGCKIQICSAFALKKPGPDIGCNVYKTWRKEQIVKMVSKGGLQWLWGKARCAADIKLPRAGLLKAVEGGEHEMVLEKHVATCDIERPGETPFTMKVTFQPKVTFKGGKAVKASLNWGDVDAPIVAKTAIWTLTAADNKLGVLQSSMVEDINDFMGPKCDEVKGELK
ncbi:MAG TPA: hypothetical protein PK264_03800 [Hyphomicrobiaceae bacterium]|nr:hypothetical protein [Hyphomicrobiaceae bacterium]